MITLYHETTRKPVTLARLMRDELLVMPYRKPELVGGIVVPEIARNDKTQSLWEILLSNAKAEDALGMQLPVGAIVQTLRRWPRDTHLVTQAGHHAFLLSVEHCGIRGIITYSEDE